jgi:hypothetical protein
VYVVFPQSTTFGPDLLTEPFRKVGIDLGEVPVEKFVQRVIVTNQELAGANSVAAAVNAVFEHADIVDPGPV